MNNLKSTVYREGEKISCPHCKSIQVKSMANQPKKYPQPKMYWHSNKKEIEALQYVWSNGYDCKKCGNEFLALQWEMRKLWEQDTNTTTPVSTEKPKKKRGFFGGLFSFLFKLALFIIAVIIGISLLIGYDRF